MVSILTLVELHIREFAARQKRHDELDKEDCIHRDCGRKAPMSREAWRQAAIASAGPLCLLDAVGQAEESWVELFERAPRCDLPEQSAPAEVRRPEVHLRFKTA